jgi:polysaccharide export outer membrane protein
MPTRALRRRTTAVTLLAIAVVAVLAALGCGGSLPPYRYVDEPGLEYRIGPGDRLRIAVWKHEEVSGEVTVRPDGNVSLPLLGDVRAHGRSNVHIAQDIEQRLGKFYTDKLPVTVQVLEVKSYRIYLLGEVQKPGEYAPIQPVTVLMGLAMGGGFTAYADPERIVIVRCDERGERRIPFSYSAVVKSGDLKQNLVLQAGDTIVVP